MKTKSILIFLLTIILIISVVYWTKPKTDNFISLKDVSSIEIISWGTNKTVYTKDNNLKEIKEFINAYNEAKPADNSLGTTPNHEVVINLLNGKKISVFGGTQSFQMVEKDGKQFNISGDKLWNYFKQLNKN